MNHLSSICMIILLAITSLGYFTAQDERFFRGTILYEWLPKDHHSVLAFHFEQEGIFPDTDTLLMERGASTPFFFFENMSDPPEWIAGKLCRPYVILSFQKDQGYFSTCRTIKLWLAEDMPFESGKSAPAHVLCPGPLGLIALKIEYRIASFTQDGLYFESGFTLRARDVIEKT